MRSSVEEQQSVRTPLTIARAPLAALSWHQGGELFREVFVTLKLAPELAPNHKEWGGTGGD
jgi:hypothetical protein